jgi:hypothetical protein
MWSGLATVTMRSWSSTVCVDDAVVQARDADVPGLADRQLAGIW